jgi:purine-nucleoside/S-methyl-5'-thioadenosine phosphorylase / adenosine deaminase
VIRWEAPGPYEVVFSTRVGGVSDGPFASLNLGVMTGDDPELVEENRRRLCGEVGADPARLALNRQVHGAEVHRALPGARGAPGDGLWSEEPGVPMLKLTADCLPIAIARTNGDRPALALVHAGWRGLLAGVVEKAVAVVGGRATAVVGPGIGCCCYAVGEDVAAPFRERFGSSVVRDRSLDLPAAAEAALRSAWCTSVERVDLCTSCRNDLFFSHRRDGERTGRQGVIGLVR